MRPRAKTADGGITLENVVAGYPFPIPKSGSEVMWNHLMHYKGLGWAAKYDSFNIDSAGVPTLSTSGEAWWEWPIYDPKKTGAINTIEPFWLVKLDYIGPPRRNGEGVAGVGYARSDQAGPPCLAVPAGSAPREACAGHRLRHAEPRHGGRLDLRRRFSVQRRDGSLRLQAHRQEGDVRAVQRLQAHLRTSRPPTSPSRITSIPDFVRWELHRVWVVEATLKPDKRHIYSKRVFYIDEDTWAALASDEYDARGQLYRSGFAFQSQSYDAHGAVGGHRCLLRLQLGRCTHSPW